MKHGFSFGVVVIAAILAFEVFNYSVTEYALRDLLGNLSLSGLSWATILAIAFCGIDFAGIARLFILESGGNEPNGIWYLFGAWLLAATLNAAIIWWGISIALIAKNPELSKDILTIVPLFVAVFTWLIRVIIIGIVSIAGDRLFSSKPTQSLTSVK